MRSHESRNPDQARCRSHQGRSAGFQTCCIAGFQPARQPRLQGMGGQLCRLEIGDTAGWKPVLPAIPTPSAYAGCEIAALAFRPTPPQENAPRGGTRPTRCGPSSLNRRLGRFWDSLALGLILVGLPLVVWPARRFGAGLGTEELYRLDRLPAFKTSVRVGSISSYDRSGGNDDGFSGKYSFVRKEPEGLVLADLTGPGVIYRLWTPTRPTTCSSSCSTERRSHAWQ